MDISIVALIASVVSICLAFFAIWQANHHRDQSDKLNRDTTEKLARIETFATSIKEDAFGEIKRYGDFWRAGGKISEEAEKAKEEEMKKLKDEIQASTAAEINKVLQTVETKLSSSTSTSTISEIKKEFEELKKEIGRIQDKAVAEREEANKRSRIVKLLSIPSSSLQGVLKTMASIPSWISIQDLEESGYTTREINSAIAAADYYGLLTEQAYKPKDGNKLIREYKLDEDLKEVLLR